MNIVLDTQVLVYATEESKHPGNNKLHMRAHHFLRKVQQRGGRLILPSVVLAEYLVMYSGEKHHSIIDEMAKQFVIAPFDVRSACVYGRLFGEKGLLLASKNDVSKSAGKRKISIDCQVIATAVACRANALISNDQDLQKLGDGYITVKEIPSTPEQLELSIAQSSATS